MINVAVLGSFQRYPVPISIPWTAYSLSLDNFMCSVSVNHAVTSLALDFFLIVVRKKFKRNVHYVDYCHWLELHSDV